MKLNVYDENSEEVLKWYLSLMKLTPSVFATFKIVFFLNEDQSPDLFENKLRSWKKEFMIPEEASRSIEIVYYAPENNCSNDD